MLTNKKQTIQIYFDYKIKIIIEKKFQFHRSIYKPDVEHVEEEIQNSPFYRAQTPFAIYQQAKEQFKYTLIIRY
jgi:hypothetical protein